MLKDELLEPSASHFLDAMAQHVTSCLWKNNSEERKKMEGKGTHTFALQRAHQMQHHNHCLQRRKEQDRQARAPDPLS